MKFGKNVLIGQNVKIGTNCKIGHNSIIEKNVFVGDNCILDPWTTLEFAKLICGIAPEATAAFTVPTLHGERQVA